MNILDTIKNNFFGTSTTRISLKDKIALLDQLSSLLHSGIPITNSIKILIYQTYNKKIKKILEHILELLNKGRNLEIIFSLYPKVFNNFDISIIRMGEITGKIADALDTIKIKEEKNNELKGKILGALIYPGIIIGLSLGMIGVFMIYIIPKIQKMYKDAKVNLPELTQTIINISEFTQSYIFHIIIGIILIYVILHICKNYKYTKIYYDYIILKIPIFGPLIQKKIFAIFTSNLSILLHNGVIINKSLEITSHALENRYYEKNLEIIVHEVSKGINLSTLMGIEDIQNISKKKSLYPIELISIIKIGEETGKMSELLGKISKKYNKEIDNTVKNIGTAIEPIVIIGVGGIVGTIIMSIMLPFFNMVHVL